MYTHVIHDSMNKEYYPHMLIIIIIMALYVSVGKGKKISAPTNWPLIGMLPAISRNLRRLHGYITEVLIESGGTFQFKGPCFCDIDMLFTADPANIDHIFSKNFSNYPKGPRFRKIFDILGDGIFRADFELWEIHRRTTLAQLTNSDFNSSLERNVWAKVESGLFPVLEHFCGTSLDLQDVFLRFTFDNICKIVLDYDPCSLSLDLPHIPCEKAFSVVAQPLLLRHIIPEGFWKLLRWLRVGSERKILECSKTFGEFIYPRVSMERGEHEKLLKAFEKVYEDKSIAFSGGLKDFLKDTSLSLIFAGRDTTSSCLTWLFYLIALNPNSEIKILEEIESQLLHDKKWRFFTAKESQKLVYLHGALCESLRLFPPLPLEHKSPARADVLPSGHYLPENAKVIISLYTVGRMESVWGKDCLEFKPERWISGNGRIKYEPSYKFPVFSAGPRTCLGKNMAFIQMKMVAAAIISNYNVKLVEGHPICPRDSILLHAKHGLKVSLSKRN